MNIERPGILWDGGGYAGAYSVGSMCAYEDYGLPSAVYMQGTSVGSISAAEMTAHGGECAHLLEARWKGVEDAGPILFKKVQIFLHPLSTHLFPNTGIQNLLGDLDCEAVIRSPVHLDITTIWERTKSRHVFSSRDPLIQENPELVTDVILASTAIPGFLPAIPIAGEYYSDGLHLSIQRAIDFGCDVIFIFLNTPQNRAWKNAHPERDIWYKRLLGMSASDRLAIEELRRVRPKMKTAKEKLRIIVLRSTRGVPTLTAIDFKEKSKRRTGDITLAMNIAYESAMTKLKREFPREL